MVTPVTVAPACPFPSRSFSVKRPLWVSQRLFLCKKKKVPRCRLIFYRIYRKNLLIILKMHYDYFLLKYLLDSYARLTLASMTDGKLRRDKVLIDGTSPCFDTGLRNEVCLMHTRALTGQAYALKQEECARFTRGAAYAHSRARIESRCLLRANRALPPRDCPRSNRNGNRRATIDKFKTQNGTRWKKVENKSLPFKIARGYSARGYAFNRSLRFTC
ncbi:hypothetical protein PUN28_016411 [Cardiocondyla obscurior]|uniref:Uncharacterized protein n=1 Tax=Cardiocondyla obscurior TaxID=286306 RepID=A0AAW2ERX1_9HYME